MKKYIYQYIINSIIYSTELLITTKLKEIQYHHIIMSWRVGTCNNFTVQMRLNSIWGVGLHKNVMQTAVSFAFQLDLSTGDIKLKWNFLSRILMESFQRTTFLPVIIMINSVTIIFLWHKIVLTFVLRI
jgi:hypothetical protein